MASHSASLGGPTGDLVKISEMRIVVPFSVSESVAEPEAKWAGQADPATVQERPVMATIAVPVTGECEMQDQIADNDDGQHMHGRCAPHSLI